MAAIRGFWVLPLAMWAAVGHSEPLEITEQQPMSFGKSYGGARFCDVDYNGTLSGDCFGQGVAATIHVSGDPSTSLSIRVDSLGWLGDLKLTPEIPKSYAYVTDMAGELTFPVRGRLQMRRPPSGKFAVSYMITVSYQ